MCLLPLLITLLGVDFDSRRGTRDKGHGHFFFVHIAQADNCLFISGQGENFHTIDLATNFLPRLYTEDSVPDLS